MGKNQIIPEKITKPIQLLAAWLVGLVLVNGSFLTFAFYNNGPDWVTGTIIIACIINVPLFLGCLFLLQTKFRPEMQEDSYYSKFLELNTGKYIYRNKDDISIQEIKDIIENSNTVNVSLISELDASLKKTVKQVQNISDSIKPDVENKKHLAEIEKDLKSSSKVIKSLKTSKQRKQHSKIHINDLLPDYNKLINELTKHNLKVTSVFGSTSDNPEIPKKRILSFGQNVSMIDFRKVAKIVWDNNIRFIHFAEKMHSKNNIYIGSYIYFYPEARTIELTTEIYELIQDKGSHLKDIIELVE